MWVQHARCAQGTRLTEQGRGETSQCRAHVVSPMRHTVCNRTEEPLLGPRWAGKEEN